MSIIARPGQFNILVPQAKNFLERYGYKKSCYCPEQELCDCCCEGLKKFQHVLAIKETGNFDLACLKAMRRPRCGNPDFLPSYGVMAMVASGHKWQKPVLTWSMLGYTRDILGKQEVRAFRDALKVWETALEGRLQFQHFLKAKLRKAVEADIVALFGIIRHKSPNPQRQMCPYDFDGELAHAFYPIAGMAGYEYLAGNCHFDDAWNWAASGNPPGGYSFLGVAIHEIGHAIGLAHSQDQQDIMYPWYIGMETLSPGDISAIREIYQ